MKNIALLFMLFLLTGCVAGQLVPATPTDYEFTLERSRAEVFDAMLFVAQGLNLNVDVLEKDSGFIQFKHSALTPGQLDKYCQYLAIKPDGQAWDTYQNWNIRSMRGGVGNVYGTVSLNAVLVESGSSTIVRIHSTWTASNRNETHQVNSLGILEGEFEKALKEKLKI